MRHSAYLVSSVGLHQEPHMGIWDNLFKRISVPEMFSNSEEGFADATFAIVSVKQTDEGGHLFHLRATVNGKTAGLILELSASWAPFMIAEEISSFSGCVRYRSIGPESDEFVQELALAYGLPHSNLKMISEVEFSAVALQGNPMTFESGKLDMKLFFEPDDENRYAEIYTNIDPEKRIAEIREKDNDYRKLIMEALTIGAA